MIPRIRPFLEISKITSKNITKVSDGFYQRFEKEFCRKIGGKKCFALHQGRIALFIALKSLEIKKGDEVIVPSYICQSVIESIVLAGGIPVFADSCKENFNISPLSIKEKITKKTKVIIAPHLFGVPCDISEIAKIAKGNNLYLIEDCAQCFDVFYTKNKKVGSVGDISFFSFGFDKPFSTGEGGMLVVNNLNLLESVKKTISEYKKVPLQQERALIDYLTIQYILTDKNNYKKPLSLNIGKYILAKNPELGNMVKKLFISENKKRILKKIKNFLLALKIPERGKECSYFKKTKSYCFPSFKDQLKKQEIIMNSLRAFLGLEHLKEIDLINRKRKENSEYFRKKLKNNKIFNFIKINKETKPVFLRYPLIVKDPYKIKRISEICIKNGFEVVGWSAPAHLKYQKYLSQNDKKHLKNCLYLAKRLLFVPVHYYVKKKDLDRLAGILNSI